MISRPWFLFIGSAFLLVLGTDLMTVPAQAATPVRAQLTVATPFVGDIGPWAGEWDETNATTTIGAARADRIEVSFRGGTANRSYVLEVESEPGQRFVRGPVRARVNNGGDLRYLGTGCGFRSYDILDIAYDGDTIVRLDLTFNTGCTGGPLAGNLRLGPPRDPVVGMTNLTWPDTAVGLRSSLVAPMWIRNPTATPLRLGTLVKSGPSAAEFTVLSDQCSARTLQRSGGCVVTVRFDPRTAGAKSASLTIAASGRDAVRADLRGSSPAGRTLLRMTSDPGEPIGGGYDYVYTEAESLFTASGSPGSIELSVAAITSDWSLWMPVSDHFSTLTVGRHAIGDNREIPGAVEFHLTGRGVGCGEVGGTVDVRQLVLGTDGQVTHLSLTFDQYCKELPGSHLRGEIAYRATDTATPPTGTQVLRTGQSLRSGQMLTADDRVGYRLSLSRGGQATVGDARGGAIWSTPPAPLGSRSSRTTSRLSVAADGSLTITDPRGVVVWQQRPPAHRAGDFLLLQSDGNLVLYSPDYLPLWSSRPLQYPADLW